MIKYLAKANNDVISHCSCDFAIAGPPMQADCPWCGCGWLIGCMKCSKAFTFAKVVQENTTYEELAARAGLPDQAPPGRISVPIDWAAPVLEEFSPGDILVYLDGCYWRLDDTKLRYDGWFAKHDLSRVPHTNEGDFKSVLRDPKYWWERELPNRA